MRFQLICTEPLYAPMFLSTFSHTSFAHLAINMYVLYSFAKPSVDYLGKEQFMALYVSAGIACHEDH